MKLKKQTAKLQLSKTTIAQLNQLEESNVKGGAWLTYYCSGSCEPTICYDCYRNSWEPVCPY